MEARPPNHRSSNSTLPLIGRSVFRKPDGGHLGGGRRATLHRGLVAHVLHERGHRESDSLVRVSAPFSDNRVITPRAVVPEFSWISCNPSREFDGLCYWPEECDYGAELVDTEACVEVEVPSIGLPDGLPREAERRGHEEKGDRSPGVT